MTPQQTWFDLPVPGSGRSRAGMSRRHRLRLPALVAFGVTAAVLLVLGLLELLA